MELSQTTPVLPKWRLYLWSILLAAGLIALVSWGEPAAVRSSHQSGPLAFSPLSGYYAHDIFVQLAGPPGGKILYTLDGREPLPGRAQIYHGPIHLPADPQREAVFTLRARRQAPAGDLGDTFTATYLLGRRPGLPVVALTADPRDLFSLDRGIYANPRQSGREWERPVTFTYFAAPEIGRPLQVRAGLRIHGDTSRAYAKKSFRLHFRDAYGDGRLDYPFFPASDVQSFEQLVLHAGGQDVIGVPHNWTLLRDTVTYQLGRAVRPNFAPHNRPVLLYLNGDFWGIYYLGERPDPDFIRDHFGIDDVALLDTPEQLARRYLNPADRRHWDSLMEFVATHDLRDPAHYATVQTQIDLDNFLDYHVVNIYFANDDFNKNNIRQFRSRGQGGRWRWLLWDVDHSFGYSPTSPVDANTVRAALQKEHFQMTDRYTLLFRKLLENPDFYNRFLTRTADLLNTALAPEYVVPLIQREAALIRPYIPREIARWSAAGANWEASVQEMVDFAARRPEIVRLHMRLTFEIPADKTLAVVLPAEGGSVRVNGLSMTPYAQGGRWQGAYFDDSAVTLTAVPAPGYAFAGWGEGYAAAAEITLRLDRDQSLAPQFQPEAQGEGCC